MSKPILKASSCPGSRLLNSASMRTSSPSPTLLSSSHGTMLADTPTAQRSRLWSSFSSDIENVGHVNGFSVSENPAAASLSLSTLMNAISDETKTSPLMKCRRPPLTRKIRLGVCAMDKKARSKQMKAILDRLQRTDDFEIVIFGDETILNVDVNLWPVVDSLIAFYSQGFPLRKAEEYAELRKPFILNDITSQYIFFNRSMVYSVLESHGLEVPRHAVADRRNGEHVDVVELEDAIEVNGMRFEKPFVEKPLSGEDHNICIYYPMSVGGGCQKLFRKIGDRSSQFYKEINSVRRDGSYLYENFLSTEGTDVKVYTIGPQYAHAEARKSPAVDGRVQRDHKGKEIRYPVMLTAVEKDIARTVSLAFKQCICGFDLLRTAGKSYVCDVNGWSFVKNSDRYYDDCSMLIREIILAKLAPERLQMLLVPCGSKEDSLTVAPVDVDKAAFTEDIGHQSSHYSENFDIAPGEQTSIETSLELRCVVAVMRHGDRTPKQKIKMKTSNTTLLSFFQRYVDRGREYKELKLKSPKALQELLDVVRKLLVVYEASDLAEDSDSEDIIEQLAQMRHVLEAGGSFSGINRKVQLKPLSWTADGLFTEGLIIVKWGGELTLTGRLQAEGMGNWFRQWMYPGAAGLLRLHSTLRHDMKIYCSDEGRVQMTAAAFAKGLLDLEGELTPILVSLVHKDAPANRLLDDDGGARRELAKIKSRVHDIMRIDAEVNELMRIAAVPTNSESMVDALHSINNPRVTLHRVYQLVGSITKEIRAIYTSKRTVHLYQSERLSLMLGRWAKLHKDMYNPKKDRFDISKVPDIYDCIKYDVMHNGHLKLSAANRLFVEAKRLADFLVPQEYGMTCEEKFSVGKNIISELLCKINRDLNNSIANADSITDPDETIHRLDESFAENVSVRSPSRHVRTRLYFTSESHIHSILNVLRYGPKQDSFSLIGDEQDEILDSILELNYLTHLVFKLYQDSTKQVNDDARYVMEIWFSPGVETPHVDIPNDPESPVLSSKRRSLAATASNSAAACSSAMGMPHDATKMLPVSDMLLLSAPMTLASFQQFFLNFLPSNFEMPPSMSPQVSKGVEDDAWASLNKHGSLDFKSAPVSMQSHFSHTATITRK